MFDLPKSPKVNVQPLAKVFKDVTNSYKFFWFLSILGSVRAQEGSTITIASLLARMVAIAWFPATYFSLSFGKQDKLGQVVRLLQNECNIPFNTKQNDIYQQALRQIKLRTPVGQAINALANYVPQRFIRPFLAQQQLRGIPDWRVDTTIRTLATPSVEHAEPPLYLFVEVAGSECIQINSHWYEYITNHIAILEGFCLWHLVRYLQKNNPNVPNVPGKVMAPAKRELERVRCFWDAILHMLGDQAVCIYSGKKLTPQDYSLDHFLPWRFVAHDLLWNIVPTTREVNSRKSDSLPDMRRYFEPFCQIQYSALRSALRQKSLNRFLEEYVLLLKVGSIEDLANVSYGDFRESLRNEIAPQLHIARNMGFPADWVYQP